MLSDAGLRDIGLTRAEIPAIVASAGRAVRTVGPLEGGLARKHRVPRDRPEAGNAAPARGRATGTGRPPERDRFVARMPFASPG